MSEWGLVGDKTEQRFSTGVALHPRGHLALSEDYFGRHNWEWGGGGVMLLVANRGQECFQISHSKGTKPLPYKQRTIWHRMSRVLTLRHPGLDIKGKGPVITVHMVF